MDDAIEWNICYYFVIIETLMDNFYFNPIKLWTFMEYIAVAAVCRDKIIQYL